MILRPWYENTAIKSFCNKEDTSNLNIYGELKIYRSQLNVIMRKMCLTCTLVLNIGGIWEY